MLVAAGIEPLFSKLLQVGITVVLMLFQCVLGKTGKIRTRNIQIKPAIHFIDSVGDIVTFKRQCNLGDLALWNCVTVVID